MTSAGPRPPRKTLISFDIDGTLAVGDPPGVISAEMVREVQRLGYVIGSCSDRPVSFQQTLWRHLEIAVDFTVLKHRLADVRARFAAARYYHVGDSDIDQQFAREAGFSFLRADTAVHRAWGPALFAPAPSTRRRM